MVENVKNQEKINFKIMLVSSNSHSINLFSKYNNITKTYKMVLFNDINLDFNISVDSNMNSNNNIDGSKYTYDTIVYLFDSKNNSEIEYIKTMYNKYFSPEYGFDYVHYFGSTTNKDIQYENEYIKLLSPKEKHYYFGSVTESTMDKFVMNIVNKCVLDVYKKITKYYDGQYSDDVIIKFIKHEILKSKQLNHIKTLQESNKELNKELKLYEQRKKSEEKIRNKLEEDTQKKFEELVQKHKLELNDRDKIINNQNENISHITNDMDLENTKRLEELKNIREKYNNLYEHIVNELGSQKNNTDPFAIVNEYIDYHHDSIMEKDVLIKQYEKNMCDLNNKIDILSSELDNKNDIINDLEISLSKIKEKNFGEQNLSYNEVAEHIYKKLGSNKNENSLISIIDRYVDQHNNIKDEIENINKDMRYRDTVIDSLEEEKKELYGIIKNNDKIIGELNDKIKEMSTDKSNQTNEKEEIKESKKNGEYTNIFNMVLHKNFYE